MKNNLNMLMSFLNSFFIHFFDFTRNFVDTKSISHLETNIAKCVQT